MLTKDTEPIKTNSAEKVCWCGHVESEHDVEEQDGVGRHFCSLCPGYVLKLEDGSEIPGYPSGIAWHRYDER